MCRNFKNFPENGKLTDSKGQTPFHIAMRGKRSETSERICTILGQYPINPLLANCSGQRPDYGKSKSDRRVQILQEAAAKFLPCSKQASSKEGKSTEGKKTEQQQMRGKKRKGGRKARQRKREDSGDRTEEKTGDELELVGSEAQEVPGEAPLCTTTATRAVSDSLFLTSVKERLKTVLEQDDDYFLSPRGVANVSVESHYQRSSSLKTAVATPGTLLKTARRKSTQAVAVNKSDSSACTQMCRLGEEGSLDADGSLYMHSEDFFVLPHFDDLPWEVEVPVPSAHHVEHDAEGRKQLVGVGDGGVVSRGHVGGENLLGGVRERREERGWEVGGERERETHWNGYFLDENAYR